MNNKNLTINNYIKLKDSSKNSYVKLDKKFDKIFDGIKKDIKNTKKTLNVLNKNFKLNFKSNDLNKFKKFKNVAIVGMGGSILGTEAIYNFFDSQIKKKFISLMTWMKIILWSLRKIKKFLKLFLL